MSEATSTNTNSAPLTKAARKLEISKIQKKMDKISKQIQALIDKEKEVDDEPGLPIADEHAEDKENDATDDTKCAYDIDETQYEVEKIMKDRIGLCGQKEYYIKWMGYGNKYNEWIEKVELEISAAEMVADYESRQIKRTGRKVRGKGSL